MIIGDYVKVEQFTDIKDTKTIDALVKLYPDEAGHVAFSILSGASHQSLYVAKRDGFVVGAATSGSAERAFPLARDMNPITYTISDVLVAFDHRRHGVGLALCGHILGQIKQQGGRLVYLFTDMNNTPANRLYAKLGFMQLDRLPTGQVPWYKEIRNG